MIIKQLKPDVVCLEIDAERLLPLISKSKIFKKFHLHLESKHLQLNASHLAYMSQFGLNPQFHASHVFFGQEMAKAFELAHEMGSIVKFIDVNPLILQHEQYPNEFIQSIALNAKSRFKLLHHQPTRTSTFGKLLYHACIRLCFKGVDMDHKAEMDECSMEDLNYQYKIWSLFHPTIDYYYIHYRNAFMMEYIRRIMRQLYYNSLATNGKRIVVIVGKTHTFGLAHLFYQFIEKEHFRLLKEPLISDALEMPMISLNDNMEQFASTMEHLNQQGH